MDVELADASVSRVAAAIAEPARARMLCCLMDGHARTSTELAVVAEVGPSTASVHLARLQKQHLVKVLAQGKHRYYSLADARVAAALEALMVLGGRRPGTFAPTTPSRLRWARTCYDHMAGTMAVSLHDRLLEREWITGDARHGASYELTALGSREMASLGGGRQLRNRIEHAQVVALSDIPRFKQLDLIASMQPTHATSDMNMAEDRVGKERIKGAYAWRTFLAQGTRIAAGSDFPVESDNPFFGLHAAVTRTDHANQPKGGWHDEQDMTLLEAFRAFTLDAAHAEHQEKTIGSLEPGKWADFILIDRDLFKCPRVEIWKIKVEQTWVAGERVY